MSDAAKSMNLGPVVGSDLGYEGAVAWAQIKKMM